MKKHFLSLIFLTGCAATMGPQHQQSDTQVAISELRQTIANQKVQIDLLCEQLENGTKHRRVSTPSPSQDSRLRRMEKSYGKLNATVGELRNYITNLTHTIETLQKRISAQDNALSEVTKLKTTLNAINKAVGKKVASSYTVQSGDTLEKIARRNHTTIAALKEANRLTSSTILVGQELAIP